MKPSAYALARPALALVLILLITLPQAPAAASTPASLPTDNPNPPASPVKLIFIHHSTGGNWLADPAANELGGGLGRALMENNYYASATNYGWGPDSIGDATDIPNWLDWFSSDKSPTYLNALYSENGQNFGDFGPWPRLAADPGGENRIILFKSCFPNSELEGKPDDAPDPEGWLSVGHAKYVYNQILKYFATRPDKLFVVITAPPLNASSTSRAAAANARAFNQWLVNDWLSENKYELANVAVFDFYNVLTGPDNHHRWNGSQIEHVFKSGQNTEYYPSGDDHPSAAGNRKAAQEFLPLLNIFYHRWAASAPTAPPAAPATATAPALPPATSASPRQPVTNGLIANFDDLTPFITANWDEATKTRFTCSPASDAAFGGASSLKLDFEVVAGSWSTCEASYESRQDWSAGKGLSFALRASLSGIPYESIIYASPAEARETYMNYANTPADSAGGWATIEIPWSEFKRAAWEENGGTAFNEPAAILAFAFGVAADADRISGTLWVDEVHLLGMNPAVNPASAPTAIQPPAIEPTSVAAQKPGPNGLPCASSLALPLGIALLAFLLRRK